MKPLTFTLASIAALGLVACQRQAAPPRTEAVPSPSPVTDAAPAEATAPGDTSVEQPQVATEAPAGRVDPATGVRIDEQPAPAPRPKKRAAAPPASRPSAPVREQRSEPMTDARPVEEPRPAPRAESSARVEQREEVVLPEGTELSVRLTEPVASDTSRPEDAVIAELVEAVRHDGRIVIPSGSEVIGNVVVAQRSGRVKGRARLVVDFHEVRVRNRGYEIEAARWDVSADSSKGRDAKIAGGAAAAGAIIGAITGGGKGAVKGAVIGGAAGGAAVLVTRGSEVELPAGVVRTVILQSPLRIQ